MVRAVVALLILGGVLATTASAQVWIMSPSGQILKSGAAPQTLFTPAVAPITCNITTPVRNGINVALVGGGFCVFTATCGGADCDAGPNQISNWSLVSQSCANCFALDPGSTAVGNLQGGSGSGTVAVNNTYTVTVTATNPQGTSPPIVETINVPPVPAAPVVVANTCNISVPVSNGAAVALSGGGNCIFTATCAGIACTGGNAITGWSTVTQSCAGCFSVDSGGNVLGAANASAVVVGNTYTMTVTASNTNGTSPQQVQTLTTPTAGGLLLEAGLPNFLLLEDGVSHLCFESGC